MVEHKLSVQTVWTLIRLENNSEARQERQQARSQRNDMHGMSYQTTQSDQMNETRLLCFTKTKQSPPS